MPLTEEQSRAINHPATGHARLPSTAGAGKSTVLMGRTVRLVKNHGISPERILVVMFGRDAAEQFGARVRRVFDGALPEIRTFHSLGHFVTEELVSAGLLPTYRFSPEASELQALAREALSLIATDTDDRSGDELGPVHKAIEELLTYIDLVKSDILPPEQAFLRQNLSPRFQIFTEVFACFERLRLQRRIRFFSDLLYEPVQLLLQQPQYAARFKGRFDHVLVDEYQDINAIMRHLLRLFVEPRQTWVFAVGDVDQCIYEWRGAQPDYFRDEFEKDFPGTTTYQISHTFRFGHRVALMANHVISHNQQRDDMLCLAAKETPATEVELLTVGTPHPVHEVLSTWVAENNLLSDAAILVRSFSQTVPIELALLSARIPYRIDGGDSVFDLPEVCAAVDLLRIGDGILESEAIHTDEAMAIVERALGFPHIGISSSSLSALARAIVDAPSAAPSLIRKAVDDQRDFIKQRGYERAAIWGKLRGKAELPPAKFLEWYVEVSELYSFFRRISRSPTDAVEREEKVEAVLAFLEGCETVESALSRLDDLAQVAAGSGSGADVITITSVHRFKGQQRGLIIIPDLREGKFPYIKRHSKRRRAMLRPDEEESERRLFFVAITRARKRLVLLAPQDKELPPWVEKEKAGYPAHIAGESDRASRFLYEAQLGLSARLGGMLHTGNFTPLRTPEPALANRYLKAAGIPFRAEAGAKR